MTNYNYSAAENKFYPTFLRSEYERSGSWPADRIYIPDAGFTEFTGMPPDGKVRSAGIDGLPMWGDAPTPTYAESVATADAQKQQLIEQANAYMNSKQWPGKAAMGRLTDSEKTKYNAWLDYLDALEAVDTTSAPDINWPTPPVV